MDALSGLVIKIKFLIRCGEEMKDLFILLVFFPRQLKQFLLVDRRVKFLAKYIVLKEDSNTAHGRHFCVKILG